MEKCPKHKDSKDRVLKGRKKKRGAFSVIGEGDQGSGEPETIHPHPPPTFVFRLLFSLQDRQHQLTLVTATPATAVPAFTHRVLKTSEAPYSPPFYRGGIEGSHKLGGGGTRTPAQVCPPPGPHAHKLCIPLQRYTRDFTYMHKHFLIGWKFFLVFPWFLPPPHQPPPFLESV